MITNFSLDLDKNPLTAPEDMINEGKFILLDGKLEWISFRNLYEKDIQKDL